MLGLAESITAGFVGLKGGLPFLMVALTVMTMALMNFMMRLYASPKTSLSAYSAFDHFDAFLPENSRATCYRLTPLVD